MSPTSPLPFTAIDEPTPGRDLRAYFERHWPGWRTWFLREGDDRRPSYAETIEALDRHLPELMPIYESICQCVDAGDQQARFLGLYRPTPFLTGCSQAIWIRGDEVALVRNYDYDPRLCDRVVLGTNWERRRVVASTDTLWGVLDGMNEDGVCAALAFGGRKIVGDGFAITLILRAVLQTATTTAQAVDMLRRVPSHMAYNVSLVDRAGDAATVYVGPDRPAHVQDSLVCTNHQLSIEWPEHAVATETLGRYEWLLERLGDGGQSLDEFIRLFLHPPLYRPATRPHWRTLYTVVYRPRDGRIDFYWPDSTWSHHIDRLIPAPSRAAPCTLPS